jgi:arylformamidase
MGAALAGASVTHVAAQQDRLSSTAQGAPVWLNMTQAELDAAYDQSVWAPNLQQVTGRWVSHSVSVRARLGSPRRYAYGPTAAEALDVFATGRPGAPVHIFIHGGQWRVGRASDYAFLAEVFVHAGAHLVVPDFVSVLETGGSLTPLVEQVRRAVAWVHSNASRFGGDRSRIYLSGHSSGAHLAGVLVTTDWSRLQLPADIIKGVVSCSGLYDLRPVRLSARREFLAITDEVERAFSPQRHIDLVNAPVVVVHGSLESPEFQRQSRDFAAALRAAGKSVQLVTGDGYNHFEICETLGNPYGVVGRAALEQLHLATA